MLQKNPWHVATIEIKWGYISEGGIMQVSVREFKNHLSKYLQRATKGESIVVTSHHIPLVRLLAIPTSSDEKLQQLLQQSNISWNGKKPTGGKKPPKIKGTTAADYVSEDRR